MGRSTFGLLYPQPLTHSWDAAFLLTVICCLLTIKFIRPLTDTDFPARVSILLVVLVAQHEALSCLPCRLPGCYTFLLSQMFFCGPEKLFLLALPTESKRGTPLWHPQQCCCSWLVWTRYWGGRQKQHGEWVLSKGSHWLGFLFKPKPILLAASDQQHVSWKGFLFLVFWFWNLLGAGWINWR